MNKTFLFRAHELVCGGHELVSGGHELPIGGHEILIRVHEILIRAYEIIHINIDIMITTSYSTANPTPVTPRHKHPNIMAINHTLP